MRRWEPRWKVCYLNPSPSILVLPHVLMCNHSRIAALGQHYEQNDSHYLALPLFLQALALCPPTSCHGVVLSRFDSSLALPSANRTYNSEQHLHMSRSTDATAHFVITLLADILSEQPSPSAR